MLTTRSPVLPSGSYHFSRSWLFGAVAPRIFKLIIIIIIIIITITLIINLELLVLKMVTYKLLRILTN